MIGQGRFKILTLSESLLLQLLMSNNHSSLECLERSPSQQVQHHIEERSLVVHSAFFRLHSQRRLQRPEQRSSLGIASCELHSLRQVTQDQPLIFCNHLCQRHLNQVCRHASSDHCETQILSHQNQSKLSVFDYHSGSLCLKQWKR